MTQEERDKLINFCVYAQAQLHGMYEADINREEFEKLSDADLDKEADWLDDLLGK